MIYIDDLRPEEDQLIFFKGFDDDEIYLGDFYDECSAKVDIVFSSDDTTTTFCPYFSVYEWQAFEEDKIKWRKYEDEKPEMNRAVIITKDELDVSYKSFYLAKRRDTSFFGGKDFRLKIPEIVFDDTLFIEFDMNAKYWSYLDEVCL